MIARRWMHNKILDSGVHRNDERGGDGIPGKAAGRDPESRLLSETAVLKKLICTSRQYWITLCALLVVILIVSIAVSENRGQPPTPATPEGMVWIPGGTFWMGCEDCGMPDTVPVHQVTMDGFWLDETPVTNAQFRTFVDTTGYVTVAERTPDAKDFPGAPPENLVPGSAVFSPPAQEEVSLSDPYLWWSYAKGASWRHPEGVGSDLQGREHYPVVHVAWDDAMAYARWAGKRLPTEAEFEFAARGGLDRKRYSWGDELRPEGKWAANIWQGRFPSKDTGEDGFRGLSPVRAFPANGYGLYDMGGNVWQWGADWYRPDTYQRRTAATSPVHSPQSPDNSFDPSEPGVPKRVTRGGSYLCSDRYCSRYLVGSRGKSEPSTGSSNVGFRCAKSVQ